MNRKLILLIFIVALICAGCDKMPTNRQVADTTYRFDYAYIALPNGETIEGEVDSWLDFADGDQLQVKINGTTYLTHATNVVLIHWGGDR